MKVALNNTKKYFIKDDSKDYHTEYGALKKEDYAKGTAVTPRGISFRIFPAEFSDKYERIKRQAQIITRKDLGCIITETGIGKKSIVLEAGSGSGASSCLFANICKKVISYEIREDHQKTAKANAEYLEIKNITFKQGDIRESIKEKNVDVVLLDMPDPWNALHSVQKALKRGGFLVVYSPTIPQVMDTVQKIQNEFSDSFIFLKTLETIQRPWEMNERKVRPQSSYINHTAFLTFIRKV
ncbi:MAG: tRNA (adenine-N1)-methyltransferase [Candidatus Woesearchaeota archaeon]